MGSQGATQNFPPNDSDRRLVGCVGGFHDWSLMDHYSIASILIFKQLSLNRYWVRWFSRRFSCIRFLSVRGFFSDSWTARFSPHHFRGQIPQFRCFTVIFAAKNRHFLKGLAASANAIWCLGMDHDLILETLMIFLKNILLERRWCLRFSFANGGFLHGIPQSPWGSMEKSVQI